MPDTDSWVEAVFGINPARYQVAPAGTVVAAPEHVATLGQRLPPAGTATATTNDPSQQARPTTGNSTGHDSGAANFTGYLGQSVGSGQCVALVQAVDPSIGRTATWRMGEAVSAAGNVPSGTIIATFGPRGTYTNSQDGSSHAAIYLGTNADGSINVVDQWTGQPAHRRTIYNAAGKSPANTASAFHVVRH